MAGMSSLSFLLLLGTGVRVAVVLHYGFRYRFLEGIDAVFAKVALVRLGACPGSPILGHWSFNLNNVNLFPAILGSTTAVILNVAGWKALDEVVGGRQAVGKVVPAMPKAAGLTVSG
jgi:hypothetical protein